jgi:hypothetical protein
MSGEHLPKDRRVVIGFVDETATTPDLLVEVQQLRAEMELIRRECWGSPWESAQKAHEIASRALKRTEGWT